MAITIIKSIHQTASSALLCIHPCPATRSLLHFSLLHRIACGGWSTRY